MIGRLAALAALCFLSGLGGYWAYQQMGGTTPPAATTPTVPQYAPDVRLTALDGDVRQLSDWRGRWVLVNFWASWCSPCIKEIPVLVEAQTRWADRGLQIIGPAMDGVDAARTMTERLQINYPVFFGDRDIANAMTALGDHLGALPYSVLIGPDGQIHHAQHGEFDSVALERLLKRYIPAPR